MKEVVDYIKTHWKNTIREPNEITPYSFTSPSIESMFKGMFYWDTYFTNVGLLIDGYYDQVYNNLKNIKYFIETMGYMPNGTDYLDRSQPPLFSKMIVDLYNVKKDKNILIEFMPSLLKEYEFWMKNKVDEFGLNAYKAYGYTNESLDAHYIEFCDRVQEYSSDLESQRQIAKNCLAICESGLDFNLRFKTETSKIDIHKFLQLDINSIMFDVENNIAFIYKELGDEVKSIEFTKKAENRKELINKYFLSSDGIYLDYNYVDRKFSSIITAVSLYPYAFGISTNQAGAKKVLEKLEFEYGLSTAEKHDEYGLYQWDYPIMWPAMVFLAYKALVNLNLKSEAERIKNKYIATIDKNFNKHHKIFEKYNSLTGEVANAEYNAPDMMGWTAGTYRFLLNNNFLSCVFSTFK